MHDRGCVCDPATRMHDPGGASPASSRQIIYYLGNLPTWTLRLTAIRPSTSGPARKYYELTDAGRAELAARREEWRALRTAFSAVLEGAPPRTHTGDQTRAADGAHA